MREWIETMRTPPNKTEGGYEYQGRIDRGTEYIDPVSRERKEFIGEDGRKYIGLLNGRGEPLQHGEDLHILWFAIDVVKTLKEPHK